MTETAAPPLIEIAHGLLAAAWRRRYVILLPILVLPVIGAVIGSFSPLSYETRMSILIQEPGKLNPFLEDLTVKTNLKDRMEALRALLTSRHVLVGVAQDVGLLEKDASESQQNSVVADLSTAVSVQLIGNEMVELRYRARQPRGMDHVLTRIGERFMERVEAPESSSMRGSVTFLREQLETATSRMEQAEQKLARFKSANAQQLPDVRATNIQRLAQISDQLSEREVQLAGADAQFTSIRRRLAQTDPVIGRLEQDIVSVRGELALLRARYTDAHTSVQGAERRLIRLEEERIEVMRANTNVSSDADRMWNMAAVATTRADGSQPLLVSQATMLEQARLRVDQLRSEVANLRGTFDALRLRVENSGEVERQLRDHERDVQGSSDLVTQLRRRFDMAKVTGDLSRFQAPQRIAVIDRPTEPTRPIRPMALLFTLGGLAAGLALGIGLTTLLELMDTSIRSARQMKRVAGLPVLARIGPLERQWG